MNNIPNWHAYVIHIPLLFLYGILYSDYYNALIPISAYIIALLNIGVLTAPKNLVIPLLYVLFITSIASLFIGDVLYACILSTAITAHIFTLYCFTKI